MTMFTVTEISKLLKLDVETIRRYIYKEELKAYKIGNAWRVKEEDLKQFIEKKSNVY